MTLLIGLNDFAPYKAISQNINSTKKLDPFIQEAQVFDLLPILGQELYHDFITDFNASPSLAIYGDLYNGSTYTKDGRTYTHEGIKPVLCYFTYTRYILNANNDSTPYGQVTKTNQYSDPLSEKGISRLADQARAGAVAYLEPVIKFLNDNSASFPLWRSSCEKVIRNSIRISAIG